jgi:hypothetical protein
LESAHADLREQLFRTPEKKLDDMVGPVRDPAQGTGVSYAAMLQGLLQHDAYHLGQVALLKKAVESR